MEQRSNPTFRSVLSMKLTFFTDGKTFNLFKNQLPNGHSLSKHKRDRSKINDLQSNGTAESGVNNVAQ